MNALSYIRSSIFSVGYFILTVSYGTLSVLTWVLPSLLRHRIIASWTTVVIHWLCISCGVRYQVLGKENLSPNDAKDVAHVVLSKHQSAWETLFLQSLFWPAATVLKKELLRIPFFGWGLIALRPIAIDRSNPREALRQVKQKGLNRLASGLNIILFPEGTRMAPGERGTYARSGADIAISAGVSILPIALNAAHCWPSNQFLKKPGLVTVSIGPKISTEGKRSKEVMKEVEDWIETEMEKIDTPNT